jgi:hypothetical protein
MTLRPERKDDELRRARALARALDSAVGIPGTPLRFGVDAIIGLIPGAGDVAGAALAAYVVILAARRGAQPEVLWRMLGNIAVDALVGAVPLIGDVFDLGFKANIRNVELLERQMPEPAALTKSSRRLGVIVVILVLALLAGIVWLGFVLTRLVWQLIASA